MAAMTRHGTHASLEEAVFGRIERQRLIDASIQLVDTPSPTGSEKAAAEAYRDIMAAAGLETFLQEIEPERFNAVGYLAGEGSGPTLMFNGHLDTSWFGEGRELPDLPGYRPKAWIEDGWIYGLGIYNMKAALACYAEAVRAVKAEGVRLKGSVWVAGVAGEVELAPVGKHQGGCFRGAGVGSRYLVTHGVTADVAVFGEPSGLRLVPGHMGYVFARLGTRGKPAHANYGDVNDSAILKMAKLIADLHAWAAEYKARNVYRDRGATISIGAIEGGTAFRCCRMPLDCSIYVDIRTTPSQRPIDARYALEDFLRGFRARHPEIETECEIFLTNPGVEIPESHPLTMAVADAHRSATGQPVDMIAEGWSSDAVHLCCYGVPGLNYGPSGRTRSGLVGWDPIAGEHCSIDDMVTATKVYAGTILRLALHDRAEVVNVAPHLPWIVGGIEERSRVPPT